MITKVIRILILSDFALQAGWGLVGPIFGVFIVENIPGGNLAVVGLIAATYWITQSVVQLFAANFLDRTPGEKDDFAFLMAGMVVANLVPLGYVFADTLWHIMLLEFVRGLAMACVIPGWYAIFTRHLPKGREAFTWSLDSTGVGIAAGFSALFGGVVAMFLGFQLAFVLVSFFGLISTAILWAIRGSLYSKDKTEAYMPPKEKIMPPVT